MDEKIRLRKEVIDEYKKLDTTSISDALDRLGIRGGLLGIKPVVEGTRLCGQAFTVHYVPCGEIKGTVGDFLDDVEPNEVVVIDNSGRLDCTVWGDIMALSASQRKIAGTVIDGVCRDVPVVKSLQYPIFTKGTYMVTGKDRVFVDKVNIPVSVSGVQVIPGDLIVGDGTGVVVVPLKRAEDVLKIATEIETKEKLVEQKIREGCSLKEARAAVNYHSLQTREA
ncbi:MAG: RraA family protein [Sporomusaceae bacterium]|nr:RraA family protein [Sporomusaceae bacterium]